MSFHLEWRPVSGVVFRDLNGDGVRDAREQGEPCGSTTSEADGTYTLQHTCGTTTVRLEFTTLPAWAISGPEGKHSGTSVRDRQ